MNYMRRNLHGSLLTHIGSWFLDQVLKKKYIYIPAVLGIIIIVFDLFRFGWKFTPFTPQEYFFPSTKVITFLQSQTKPFRVMSLDDRLFPPNTSAYYGIESVEGYDPVYDAQYEEFIAALNRQKPDIAPPFGFNRIITVSTINSKLLPLLNVKFILSLDDVKSPDVKLVDQEGQTKIYTYLRALPRMYPVESVVQANSRQQVMDILYSPTFSASSEAVVQDTISLPRSPVIAMDKITVLSESASGIRATSSLADDHFVVIANSFDAHWNAFIDGVSTPIYRTDYTFQGIIVPKGNHTIVVQ